MAIRFKPKDREDFMRAAELTEEQMTAIEQESLYRLALAFNGSGVAGGYYIFRIPDKGEYAVPLDCIERVDDDIQPRSVEPIPSNEAA